MSTVVPNKDCYNSHTVIGRTKIVSDHAFYICIVYKLCSLYFNIESFWWGVIGKYANHFYTVLQ